MTNTPRDEDRATWRNTPRPSRIAQATDAGYEPLPGDQHPHRDLPDLEDEWVEALAAAVRQARLLHGGEA